MKTRWIALVLGVLLMAWGQAGEPLVIGREGKGGKLEKLPLPEPVAFEAGGKKGWKIAVPGNRPLATAAVADGVIYVGGGFGSHEFYAIEAKTGKLVWGFKTGDDGPTAAVVAEGVVAYNTESCTIYVHDAKDGKLLWERWLGDPLMSQPAIAAGKVYMAYPGQDGSHHLACFELRTGKPVWDQKIIGEVITAPVISGGNVYCACLEGTVYKFAADDGKQFWAEQRKATSAPYIDGDKVFVSEARDGADSLAALRKAGGGGWGGGNSSAFGARLQSIAPKAESLNAFSAADPKKTEIKDAGAVAAPFLQDEASLVKGAEQSKAAVAEAKQELEAAKNVPASKQKEQVEVLEQNLKTLEALDDKINRSADAAKQEFHAEKQQDAAVAFAVAPQSAKLSQSAGNFGKNSVCGVWAFQGSRPLVRGDKSFLVQGELYRCIDNSSGKVVWEEKLESKAKSTRPATPPSEAGGKHYLGTVDGEIVCRNMSDGKAAWSAQVGGVIVFQPAVMDGRVIAGTQDGTLICIETGDASATGWAMWGANAAHDGKPMGK